MWRHRVGPRWAVQGVILTLASASQSCERAPAEPEGPDAAHPIASVAPLLWAPPPSWNVERTAASGQYRAKYRVPSAGDAKHEAEVLVTYLGRGKESEVDDALADLLLQFEGEGSKKPTRESFEVGAFRVRMLDVGATYKFPMGPPVGSKKRAPAHVIKEGWRAIAFGVIASDRGNWLFQMVGPSDTVEASRSSFRAMIDGLR